jgi:putative endonuclease
MNLKERGLMHSYYAYITTNRSGGLYIGVTNDLERRIGEHKSSEIPGFTQKYRMHRLVYSEEFSSRQEAIDREKQLKGWRREKKIALIEAENPEWRDLFFERP